MLKPGPDVRRLTCEVDTKYCKIGLKHKHNYVMTIGNVYSGIWRFDGEVNIVKRKQQKFIPIKENMKKKEIAAFLSNWIQQITQLKIPLKNFMSECNCT